MKDDQARFLQAGFTGYLVKPIDIKAFPEQVRRFLPLATGDQAANAVQDSSPEPQEGADR